MDLLCRGARGKVVRAGTYRSRAPRVTVAADRYETAPTLTNPVGPPILPAMRVDKRLRLCVALGAACALATPGVASAATARVTLSTPGQHALLVPAGVSRLFLTLVGA